MRGVQGRSPDMARACRRTATGRVQLRADVDPEIKDALIRGAQERGVTLREHVEDALRIATEMYRRRQW